MKHDEPELIQVLEDFRRRLALPAVGAAIVDSSGDVLCDVSGERLRGGAIGVDIDDQWHIGSCGKALTALLYARLVELGHASWGATVADLLPDLVERINAEWITATIDDLLVCRAGMRANLGFRDMKAAWNDERPLDDQRTLAAVEAMSRSPRRPGSFRYSNLSYVVTGAVIDRVAGESFERAIQRHVLDPLGITSFGFGAPPDIWGHRPRVQLSGTVIGRGAPADPQDPRSDNPTVLNPAGRFHLNLRDWATLQRVFLVPGILLQPASVERLLAVPTGEGRGMAMGWAPTKSPEIAPFGQQGSNTMWAATALMNPERTRTAMVVTNDGRTRVLLTQAQLAQVLLEAA